ncbi:MAG: hypothetical protein A2V66_01705 [Ignavibacteria bacterium RBG_13_36_8]|nr:MAG: hypothetical protein A2V66_01705 [Ignavibacteria bacterium RBG_13_36_8]
MIMKKILFLITLLLFSSSTYAQFDFAGGMGISFVNNSSLRDYLQINFPSGSKLSTFNSSVEFFIEGDYSVTTSFQLGLEYAYQIYSYTASFSGTYVYDISYGHHKPSVLAYYVISGNGYKFKFGGGAGLRIISLDEKIMNTVNYSTSGFGVLLKAQGHTLLGGNFYANIGVDLRYDLPGEPKNGSNYIVDNSINQNVNINSLSFGIKLGISYFFE